MKVKQDAYDVGVIVARFQVPDFHEAHVALIEHVQDEHERVIIFLGLSGAGQPTKENSLDFTARWQMIRASYPDIEVHYIHDMGDDQRWSRKLDEEVRKLLPAGQTAVLYGGRDSFVGRYFGKLPTRELEPEVWVSGTDIRRKASKKVRGTRDFRLGVFWATHNRFPAVMPTVDAAVLDEDRTRLLLGQKDGEPLWRFLGGFVDALVDESFELAARREIHEEAGIEVVEPKYLGTFTIDDWRYRGEDDKIITSFFYGDYLSGQPRPGDDIATLKWFDVSTITDEDVMPSHRPLLHRLLDELKLQAMIATTRR